jgi:two-component system sensor histidine kinase/response regulator
MLTTNPSIILIVDDQPTNLKMLFSFLQEASFKVLVAKTGESAIKKLQKVSPDLILLDVTMPGIDGFETCRRLKASTETKDIPVIFMTALSETTDKIKGFKLGAVDYITKPFQQDEVLARIENQIKLRRLQKQLEEQNQHLQQSQLLLASVLNSSLDGVAAFEAIRDSQGNLIDFKWLLLNPAAEKMLERAQDELVSKSILRGLPGICETGLFEKFVHVVETGEPLEIEHDYEYGKFQIWLQIAAVKLSDGFAVTFRNITERRRAEEALGESERRFRAIFNNSFQFTGLLTSNGTVIEINQTALDFTGIQHSDIAGLQFWQARWWTISPETQHQLKQAIASAARGEFVRYEVDIRGAGDTVATLDFSLKPVLDESGNVVLLILEGRDISQRKQAEERLRLLESVVVNANDAVIIAEAEPIDMPGPKIIYVNEAFTRMTGYSSEEVIGKTPRILQSAKTDRTQLNRIRHALETWQPVRVELINYRKDGSEFWVELEIVPVPDQTGWFTHWVSVQRDITQRKQAQEALLIARKRLEYLLSSSPSIIYSCKPTVPYGATFISENLTTLFGYEPREFLENASFWINHIHPEDSARVLAEIQQLFEVGHHAYEYRFLHKDGTYHWVLDALTVVHDEDGNPIEMIGSWIDVTPRKQVEEALQESQHWLSAIAEANPNILYVYDLIEQRNVYANREMFPILGYTPEEVQQIGTGVLQNLMHPDDFAVLPEHLSRFDMAEDGDIFEFEYRMRHKNGEWLWLCSRETVFIRTSDGMPWQVLGTATDINDRKQAELEIMIAKAALERQIQRVLLQERITQEIRSSLKPEQVFQTAAYQIGQAFGVNRCLIHTYIDYPIPRLPTVAEYKEPSRESILSLEIPVRGNPHMEILLTQDHAIASDNVYTEPLLEAASSLCRQLGLKSMLAVRTSYQGKPNGSIGIHQYDRFRHWTDDEIEVIESVAAQLGIAIAQANLLEQEKQQRQELALQNHALEKAKLQAEAANRAKSQFLSKMSHELRTPLNAILGFTQVMAHDDSLKTEQLEYLGIINRSGEHLLELINDILSVSQIEAGQVSLNEQCFDLYRLLDSLEEMLQLKASSKGLQMIVELSPHVPQYVQTDEAKLRQVLINLLGNAIKFTQKGTVTLRVGMDNREWGIGAGQQGTNPQFSIPDSRLLFEVEDTGPGIAPNELGTLFEPFIQTQTGRQSMEGTGLGLPISQQFVHLMGGDITVRSTLGQGSIFTFDIQVGLANSADKKSPSSKRRVIGLEPNQPSYRLLVVEDAAVNRKLLVKILEPLGFEVRTASNGQEGVALWESWAPHLVWMDMIMPVMDGYEATQQIKQTPRGENTVIIALTASAFEEQQEAVLSAGCDDFLPKPFQPDVMLEKIAHHLGVRYVYEEEQLPTSVVETFCQSVSTEALTPEALAVMPASWVSQLHQAALYADDDLINQLIEQIPLEYGSLRGALRELLNNFRLEQLINITESAGS